MPEYWLLTFTGYYITSLLYNVVEVALYVVLLFTPHHQCLTRNGYNVTSRFEFLIVMGLIVATADTLNTSIFSLYCRFMAQAEEKLIGFMTSRT